MRWVAPSEKDDAFGRIYEYFLGQFARTEEQKGGVVVQSARFVAKHKKNPASELSILGVEKTDETGRLARGNLAAPQGRRRPRCQGKCAPLPLRPAAHRQRQLPLDPALPPGAQRTGSNALTASLDVSTVIT